MAGINRTAITIPGSDAVIHVTDEELDARLGSVYKKVRGSRRADTGSIPTQSGQSSQGNR